MIEKLYEAVGFWSLVGIFIAGSWGVLLSFFIPTFGKLCIFISLIAVVLPICVVWYMEFKSPYGKSP